MERILKPLTDLVVDGRFNVRIQEEAIPPGFPALVEAAIIETAGTNAAIATATGSMALSTNDIATTTALIEATLGEIPALIMEQTLDLTAVIDKATIELAGTIGEVTEAVTSGFTTLEIAVDEFPTLIEHQTNAIVEAVRLQTTAIDSSIETAAATVGAAFDAQTLALGADITAVGTTIATAITALATDIDTAVAAGAASTVVALVTNSVDIVAGIAAQTLALTIVNPIPGTSNLNDLSNHLSGIEKDMNDTLLMVLAAFTGDTEGPHPYGEFNVKIGDPVKIDGTVHVDGTVSVGNLPAVQPISLPDRHYLPVVNFHSNSYSGNYWNNCTPAWLGLTPHPQRITESDTVTVSNLPEVQHVALPDRTYIPVVNYSTNDPQSNYWNDCNPAWTGVEPLPLQISEDTGDTPTGTLDVNVTNDVLGVNIFSSGYAVRGAYPLPVTLVQPHSGADIPNTDSYNIEGSSGWHSAEARVITADALVNSTRLETLSGVL